MFGYVQVNPAGLTEEEKERYRALYCGVCRTLGKRHGFLAKMGLNYDLTFLALLLTSLYEPDEVTGTERCVIHPAKKHTYTVNRYTEYAADMTVALTYHKCLDDWNDDKSLIKKGYALTLAGAYGKVKEKWRAQCDAIEKELGNLSQLEEKQIADPDAAASCFGRLMAVLFAVENDIWQGYLRNLGDMLGRFIYLADAAVDMPRDIEKDSYNPLVSLSLEEGRMRAILQTILGQAADAFEKLPLVKDKKILGNILYSGIWIKYDRENLTKKEKKA